MTDRAPAKAARMVKDGMAPSHLRNLVEAAFRAARSHGYPAQLTNEERGKPCKRSRIAHDIPDGGTATSGRIFICDHAGSDAVWDLLHELGHALHGHAPGKEKTCAHETAMWQRGWDWAVNQSGHGSPLTTTDKAEFNARASECLASYCKSAPSAVV